MEGLYITRDQLWTKPRPTFEPGGGVPSGLLDVCSTFARSCTRGITYRFVERKGAEKREAVFLGPLDV